MERKLLRKIMLIGSGGIKIAEAAEFDYSSSQALKALKDLGVKSVVFNPNIATVQTSYSLADSVYILPISQDYLKRVIAKEKPDGILSGFGGQTALSACLDLWDSGFLEDNSIEFLGTKPEGIRRALGRADFQRLMKSKGIPVPPSFGVKNAKEATDAAEKLGFPVMCRVSFNLGGRGSFIAHNIMEFKDSIGRAFAQSGTGEALIEKYLTGWKELEYEVMRDCDGNAAVIACLENLDPMGTHTGESTVVAPAQTLDNYIYQKMRSVAIEVAESIDLVGECNVQFALDPNSYEFYVIETNPRMSRSSALASKVTGYPIAYVATKLALGFKLHELKNEISYSTSAFFEPSLDYIAVKMPRWDIQKFEGAENSLGSEMKSIGEVMGIGRNFEEAMQKAVRMLDIGEEGLISSNPKISALTKNECIGELREKRPYWFLYAMEAFKKGAKVEEVKNATGVNAFFLEKLFELSNDYAMYKIAKGKEKLRLAKAMLKKGFSEKQLGVNLKLQLPKRIDTLAGEWPSNANYMYLTRNANGNEVKEQIKSKKSIMVLGAGCFRIGVSVEFDYATTVIADVAKRNGYYVSMLNCNPETVSTDWNRSDMLFFDSISTETVLSVSKNTGINDVILFTAGQLGNNIAGELAGNGIKILGSSHKSIEMAEDRESFSNLLESLGIEEPEWSRVTDIKDASSFARGVGFPVLIRPSFVLSGASMGIARNEGELLRIISNIERRYRKKPIVISKFIADAEEADLDCAGDGRAAIGIPLFHIEKAGIHSGDSTMRALRTDSRENASRRKELEIMEDDAIKLVKKLGIRGPFNLQFAIKNHVPYVIELNMRASRSMPFSSKAAGIELMEYGFKGSVSNFNWSGFNSPKIRAFGVKSPQFSWAQLKGTYPSLGPEMHSTGEVASFDTELGAATLKSWLAAQPNQIPKYGALVYGGRNVEEIARNLQGLGNGFNIYTLEKNAAKNTVSIGQDEAVEYIRNKKIGAVFSEGRIPEYDYRIRRACADFNVPLILDADLGLALSENFKVKTEAKELRSYW